MDKKEENPHPQASLVCHKRGQATQNKRKTSKGATLHESDLLHQLSNMRNSSSMISIGSSSPTNFSFKENMYKHNRIILNVGGDRHEVLWDTLDRHKQTRLGQLRACTNHSDILKLCDEYSLEQNEYFWDRSPQSFNMILSLYRRNTIHMPDDVCAMDFREELQYWGIDESHLDSCCSIKYIQKIDELEEQVKKNQQYFLVQAEDKFGSGVIALHRKWLWDLFEKSNTVQQKIIEALSITMIALSIITLCLSSIPQLYEFRCKHENTSFCDELWLQVDDPATDPENFEKINNRMIRTLEICCVVWFSLKYLLRLLAAPSKRKFILDWLNAIDLLAIIPFYVSLFLVQHGITGRWIQFLRAIAIMRIFKLVRHSTGLQCLGYTLRHSYQYLGVLLLFLSMGVIIFSTLAYFAESEENPEGFESIPNTFYWALITMTTIGYGDVSPVTLIGKIISSFTGITGVIAIALPIPTIVSNFTKFYEEHKRKQRALKRQKNQGLGFSDSTTVTSNNSNNMPNSDGPVWVKSRYRE